VIEMNLVLLGPPGAGKGTQATRLGERFGLQHLSSGDLLRSERAKGSALGQKVASYMDAGQLVPDDIIIEAILGQFREAGRHRGFLLDGFPRTVTQAENLDRVLAGAGARVNAVLSLEVPDNEIVDRITGRRICPVCGRVYHEKNRRPARTGVCDNDQTPLIQRKDDTVDVVRQRLAAYHAQTEPLEEYYRGQGKLFEVDGTQDVETVFSELSDIVGKRAKAVS
jgi:adenylate kinase